MREFVLMMDTQVTFVVLGSQSSHRFCCCVVAAAVAVVCATIANNVKRLLVR